MNLRVKAFTLLLAVYVIFSLASCGLIRKQKTKTDITQTTQSTTDSVSKKDSSVVKVVEVKEEVKVDSSSEETNITEVVTVKEYDTSGKITKETNSKKTTEKKKKQGSGSASREEKKSDSTGVATKTEVNKTDSSYTHFEQSVKQKTSWAFPYWILFLLAILLIGYYGKYRWNKKLWPFLLILFFSCSKSIEEPVKLFKPASQLYMTHVANHDTAQGVRSTFEVKNLGGNGSTTKAVWLACYIQTISGEQPWIQVGYHQWGGVSMFSMQFYSLVKGVQLGAWPVLASGTIHSFHIRINEGWVYVGVDNIDYVKYPHNATHITTKHISLEGEGTATKPGSLPVIRFDKALEILRGGQWIDAPTALSSGSGYGVLVNGINDVSMGSNIKTKPGTQLW